MKSATSFQALTKPANPLPSAHLAAGAALLAIAKRALPKTIDKAEPIVFEGVARTCLYCIAHEKASCSGCYGRLFVS